MARQPKGGDFFERVESANVNRSIGELTGNVRALQVSIEKMDESTDKNFNKLYDMHRDTLKLLGKQRSDIDLNTGGLKYHREHHKTWSRRFWALAIMLIGQTVYVIKSFFKGGG